MRYDKSLVLLIPDFIQLIQQKSEKMNDHEVTCEWVEQKQFNAQVNNKKVFETLNALFINLVR